MSKVIAVILAGGTGVRLGPATGDPARFGSFDALFGAFETQLRHLVDVKIRGNQIISRLYATAVYQLAESIAGRDPDPQ